LGVEVGADKFYACWNSEDLLLCFVLRPQDLEDGVEIYHKSLFVGFVLPLMIKDSFGGEHKRDGRSVVRFEVKGAAEYGIVGGELVIVFKELPFVAEVHLYIITAILQPLTNIA